MTVMPKGLPSRTLQKEACKNGQNQQCVLSQDSSYISWARQQQEIEESPPGYTKSGRLKLNIARSIASQFMGDRLLLLSVEHWFVVPVVLQMLLSLFNRSLPPSDSLILSPSITAMNPCRRSSRCSMDIMRTKRKSRVFSQPGKMKRRERNRVKET